MIQHYINHVAFVLDASGSMASLRNEVIGVFNQQIKYLAQRSKELNQETRVSVYIFNDAVKCLVYDIDVLRMPEIDKYYNTMGSTALIDATLKAIEDLKKTPELYGDHAFLFYDLTDGGNNINNHLSNILNKTLSSLPENYTVGVLVPDQTGVYEAKKFGFPSQNIQVWSTTKEGIKEVGNVIQQATEQYFVARASGVRSTKSLFNLDSSTISSKEVKQNLVELKSSEYELLNVGKESYIKDFIESWKLPFVKGANYYQITKPETVQAYKQVCIQDKMNGKVYGGTNARKILGLPDYELKVNPASFGKYDIFIQSTSSNRKLVKGTKLIVLK